MKCTSVSIHVPKGTVLMGDDLPYTDEFDEDDLDGHCLVGDAIMLLDALAPTLLEKVEQANLESDENAELLKLLEGYGVLLDCHLGHTALIAHVIVTKDAKPINFPPYRTSPAYRYIIEE